MKNTTRTRSTTGNSAKRWVHLLALIGVMGMFPWVSTLAQSPASLNSQHGIGSLDPRPTATLLLPYFEIDLDGTDSTRVRVRNASPQATLAHVSLWTDMARPSLGFHIYLTGFDEVELDLSAAFRQGILPATGPSVSPSGPYSGGNQGFQNCQFPLPASIPPAASERLRAIHTGMPVPPGHSDSNLCGASRPGDNKARGYVLIDVVDSCSPLQPDEAGYFADGGGGIATNDNRLWGDYLWEDGAQSLYLADSLVPIEARSSVANGFWEERDFTFFARYVGHLTIDNREPLPTSWATEYTRGDGAQEGPTELLCWRDSGLWDSFFFSCTLDPDQDEISPYRLAQTRLVVFDREENPIEIPSGPFSPPIDPGTFTICPLATGRINASEIPMVFSEGWIYLELNTNTGALTDPFKQSHVTVVNSSSGSTTSAHAGTHLDNALVPIPPPFPDN